MHVDERGLGAPRVRERVLHALGHQLMHEQLATGAKHALLLHTGLLMGGRFESTGPEARSRRPRHWIPSTSAGVEASAIGPATKISIRLDNAVLEHFRRLVDKAGGGNYQTLINDALLKHIQRRSILDVVRAVVREELASYRVLEALRQKLSRKSALGTLALPDRRSKGRRAAGANPGQHRRQLN